MNKAALEYLSKKISKFDWSIEEIKAVCKIAGLTKSEMIKYNFIPKSCPKKVVFTLKELDIDLKDYHRLIKLHDVAHNQPAIITVLGEALYEKYKDRGGCAEHFNYELSEDKKSVIITNIRWMEK